ncbi:aminotransferase-like domain-containing protein [Microbacterium gilvum]|uniref:PLP-dependent aminotransferase family protein n=1 Tax=Microbacterium gilvum TaxID=1336204 RepID=A0ABP8ZWE8_9MICO
MTQSPRLSRFAAQLDVPRTFVEVLGNQALDSIDLLGGNPPIEALPLAGFAEAVAEAASIAGAPAFQYSSPRGIPALVEQIAHLEGVGAERVVVTNGALHALSLATLALVDPGDVVVVDDPVFPVFRRVLQLADANVVPVPVDRDGLDVDRLEALLAEGLRPRLVYTVPDFQNPTGGSLSVPRREKLAELARRYGFFVLWDNPYRRSRWAGEPLKDADPGDDVFLRIDTFSKSLGPGLRLGWIVVPESLVPAIIAVRSRTDQHPSTLIQTAVASLLADGGFADITRALAAELRVRAETLTSELRARLGDAVTFHEPQGGFFLWARLNDPTLSVARLNELSSARGTQFSRGTAFAVPGGRSHDEAMRLGFSSTRASDIPTAVARLADAWGQLADEGEHHG